MHDSLRRRHPLSDALSVILPDQDYTLLLRGCLEPGERGRQACEAWLQRHNDHTKALTKEFVKSLLPLLDLAIRRHKVRVNNFFLTVLKTATLREQLRTKTYRRICKMLLSALAREQIPIILIKGAALGETVYDDPYLRHSHDIELVARSYDLNRILESVRSLGFARQNTVTKNDCESIQFKHPSGLPLVVRNKLFGIPFYNDSDALLWSDTETKLILDMPTRVLRPARALVHVCGQAVYPIRSESFRWIVDAWFIVDKCPDLEWELLLDYAKRCHLLLPLSVMLGYLAKELRVPVPPNVLDRLCVAASKSSRLGRELALFSVRVAPDGGARRLLLKAQGVRGRMHVIQWMLLPSAAYMFWGQNIGQPLLLPYHYARRALKCFVRGFVVTSAMFARRMRSN